MWTIASNIETYNMKITGVKNVHISINYQYSRPIKEMTLQYTSLPGRKHIGYI